MKGSMITPSVPSAIKRKIKLVGVSKIQAGASNFVVSYRMALGQERLIPDFIIIGAQRCGTTYLYGELTKHPRIAPALKKEVHFFDLHYKRGVVWYRAHFPAWNGKRISARDFVTGEASPYYLFHPHVPKRVAKLVPNVKLIVLLRNPVDRAYSHYHHEVRRGFESLSFQDAIDREQERVVSETKRMVEDEDYCSFNHRRYSYLSRGIYVDQLKSWRNIFPKEQMLILRAEDFYHDPSSTIEQITSFLNLPTWKPEEGRQSGYPSYPKMDPAIRKYLIDYFEPQNQRLYGYLGVNLGWEK